MSNAFVLLGKQINLVKIEIKKPKHKTLINSYSDMRKSVCIHPLNTVIFGKEVGIFLDQNNKLKENNLKRENNDFCLFCFSQQKATNFPIESHFLKCLHTGNFQFFSCLCTLNICLSLKT